MALEAGRLHSAINRMYYACFYMVSALLRAEGHTSSKHTGIRALFIQHWIKPGRLPTQFSDCYRELFDLRHQGDYDDFAEFSLNEVRAWYDEAQSFLARIGEELDVLMAADAEEEEKRPS